MGATAMIAPLAKLTGSLLGKLMPAPKLPEVTPPPTPDDAANADAASAADQRARRKVIGASGRADTILTGPQGLGGVPSGSMQAKTLLGQ